ncbi:MAG: hypothetical protein AAGE52_04310 [Myxococcota bacterium]
MIRVSILLFALGASTASADARLLTDGDGETPWSQRRAFDRNFAIGIYGMGWGGAYAAGGAGARLRYEFRETIGIEVYSDHLRTEASDGLRHDHPIVFNLYIPFRLSENWRIRPLFGFCTVFSFFHPDQEGVDRVDDVHFGAHAGAGLEAQLGRWASVFLDLQGTAYLGHDRYQGGWATHVGDELTLWGIVEAKLGVQVHL